MAADVTVVVAVEDEGTVGVVGAAAAHIAMELNATKIVLLHVLEHHSVSGGLLGLTLPVPVAETLDECGSLLARAEEAVKAEYSALGKDVPSIARQLEGGDPGQVISSVAEAAGARAIMVGGRRPHAFGRLAHPDVGAWLRRHTDIPIRVAPLQASEPSPAEGEVR